MKYLHFFLLGMVVMFSSQTYASQKPVVKGAAIKITMEGALPSDTLVLKFYDTSLELLNREYMNAVEYKSVKDLNGHFLFQINTRGYGYFTLAKSSANASAKAIPQVLLHKYLVANGDDITIAITNQTRDHGFSLSNGTYFRSFENRGISFSFSGYGYAKYLSRYEADRVNAYDSTYVDVFKLNSLVYNPDNRHDRGLARSLEILNQHKNQMSLTSYQLLKADFIGKYWSDKYHELNVVRDYSKFQSRPDFYKKLNTTFKTHFLMKTAVPDEAAILSKSYASALVFGKIIHASLTKEAAVKTYSFLKKTYSGELKDRVITLYLLTRYGALPDAVKDDILNDAIATVSMDKYNALLTALKDSYAKGKTAYNFELPDVNGKMVKLEDFKGKVVFVDFYYSGCGACKDYYHNTLSKVEHAYKDNPDVVFLTVSVDKDRQKWLNEIEKETYTSKDVINLYTAGQGYDHSVIKNYKIFGYPQPMLIDREGKIFTTSDLNLRRNGIKGLTETIEAALQQ